MPITRSATQKQIEEAKQFFGLPFIDSELDKSTLNRFFKKKVNSSDRSDNFWQNLNKKAFLLLTEYVSLAREKNEDILYAEMMEQAKIDDDDTIHVELQGLQSVCHKKLCQVLVRKFKLKMPKKIPNMSINIENISIPYNTAGKGQVYPPVQIKSESLATSIKLSITGQSSLIFLIFHLEKILESFLLEIPVKIEDLYTFPSQSSTSEQADDQKTQLHGLLESDNEVEIEDKKCEAENAGMGTNEQKDEEEDCIKSPIIESTRAKLARKAALKVKEPCNNSESNKNMYEDMNEDNDSLPDIDLSEAITVNKQMITGVEDMDKNRREDDREDITADIDEKNSCSTSVPNDSEFNQHIYVAKDDMEEDKTTDSDKENGCSTCALVNIAQNIEILVKDEEITTILPCDTRCMDIEDPLLMLVLQFFTLVSDLSKLNAKTLSTFKKNFKIISKYVLEKEGGSHKFFCIVLERFIDLNISHKNRVVRLLNEVTKICIGGQVHDFENEMSKNNRAKKNLTIFLFETGAIYSIHAVIEAFHKMHKLGVDISSILPERLSGLISDFNKIEEQDNIWAHHSVMNKICRRVITMYLKERNITLLEISSKVYTRQKDVHKYGTDFIYFDKIQREICHFIQIKNKMCSDCIPVEDLMFSKIENALENEYWKFFLTDKSESHFKTTIQECVTNSDLSDPKKVNEQENVEVEEMDRNERDEEVNEDNDEPYDFGRIQGCDTNTNLFKPFTVNKINSKDRQMYENRRDEDKRDKDGGHNDMDEGKETEENDMQTDLAKNVITTRFDLKKETIMKYWNPVSLDNRKFQAHLVGSDWPRLYNSVCCVVLEYNHAKKYNSRKRKENFAKLIGICTICSASHTYTIVKNPFDEKVDDKGICYIPKQDMTVEVTVYGQFDLTNNEPDISKPYHKKENVRGKFCKGQERQSLGKRAAEIGPVQAYLEQFDDANMNEIRHGNKTSIRTLPVIKGAKSDEDKKIRGGNTFYESARSAKDLLSAETYSPNFPENNAAKNLPGLVRSLQESPFKIMIGNFDMLKIGGTYLNKVADSVICIDSSGKYWQEKNRAGKKLLNTALVIPPVAAGLSPFPIFEMVSEDNKTLDFVEFLQRAMGHMGTALNNTPVKEPNVLISDLSFPNIHAALNVFNHVKLEEYLAKCYRAMMTNSEIPFPTKVTICESHLIPILLKAGREIVKDKIIGDTCVAGLLQVLRAPTIEAALSIWEKLVLVHVSKNVNPEAREYIKNISMKNVLSNQTEEIDIMVDIDDNTPEDEVAMYGDRKSMRTRSPYFNLFSTYVSKVISENEKISNVSNELYAPEFFSFVVKQFLSLFPFITASVLEGDLLTNAHIELHWKALRAQMSRISKSQQWPTVLLGQRHTQTRRQAKEIMLHSLIPGLKFGGKTQEKKDKHTDFMDELGKQFDDKNVFNPTPTKKKKKVAGRVNESFDGSQEQWQSKVKRTTSIKERRQN